MNPPLKAMPPSPGDEITLSWLLENPITRSRTICSLAGIISDFNDLSPEAAADADTRDLWFLANQIWRTLDRPEVEAAFCELRNRSDSRRLRRDTKLHNSGPTYSRRPGHSEARAAITDS